MVPRATAAPSTASVATPPMSGSPNKLPPQIAVAAGLFTAQGMVSLPTVVVTTMRALVPVTPVGVALKRICLPTTDMRTVP